MNRSLESFDQGHEGDGEDIPLRGHAVEVFLDQMEPLRRCTEEAAMGPALGKRTHQRPAWRALSPQPAVTESGIAFGGLAL